MKTRNLRKERIGTVTSNKMEKSIVVSEVKKVKHPMYGKFVLKTEPNVKNSQWLTVVNLKNHKLNINDLRNYLFKEGIETKKVFYPIDRQKIYNRRNKCLNSFNLYKSSLCLPSFPDLSNNQINFISNRIKSFISY